MIAMFFGYIFVAVGLILFAVFGSLFGFFMDIPRAGAWLFYGPGHHGTEHPLTRLRTGIMIQLDMFARVLGYRIKLEAMEGLLASST